MDETAPQISVDQLPNPETLPTREVVHWVFTYVGNLVYTVTVRPDLNEEMRTDHATGSFNFVKCDDRRNILSATSYEAANRLHVAYEKATEPIYPAGQDPRKIALAAYAREMAAQAEANASEAKRRIDAELGRK